MFVRTTFLSFLGFLVKFGFTVFKKTTYNFTFTSLKLYQQTRCWGKISFEKPFTFFLMLQHAPATN